MPQIQLPIFPASSTPITSEVAFQERDAVVWYFNGHLPVFSHPATDIAFFRFFTSQLIANGNASQSEISRAFGVRLVSVKRACKKLRDEGAAGFFRPPVPRQGHKLTDQRHQTAILSTDYRSELARSAATMFARWNQENFFKYMREHYGLDRLVEHGISPVASLCSPLRGCLSAGCLAALGS